MATKKRQPRKISPPLPPKTQLRRRTSPASAEEEAASAAEGGVTSLNDVKAATVQIIAEGTFRDPEIGFLYNAAGAGSGFIIDPSGLAVTNNHVVTGAALLQVYVGGETDRVYNARVLGVSECSDLAVIYIEGDGFPFLQWYEDEIDVGLDVYAAGFPLGDPEYTLTQRHHLQGPHQRRDRLGLGGCRSGT